MNILVVDDNALVLELMTRLFESEGHRVITADDGYDALKLIQDDRPDAAFIDMFMPRIEGDKLCKLIRKMPEFSKTRLVLMSGAAEEEELNLSDIGADMFLSKGGSRALLRNTQKILQALEEEDAGDEAVSPGAATDDPHQHQVALELLGRQEHLQEVFNTIFNGVVEIEGDTIVYANTAATYLLGRTIEELQNTSLLKYFDEDPRAAVREILAGPGAPEREVGLSSALPLNNRWVLIQKMAPVKDVSSAVLLFTDVSDMIRAEEELRGSNQRLETLVTERKIQLETVNRRLEGEALTLKQSSDALGKAQTQFEKFMDHLPAAAFIKDDSGRYVMVNAAFGEQFGKTPEQCMGKRDSDLWPPETAARIEKYDRLVFTREEPLHAIETLPQTGGDAVYHIIRFPIPAVSGPALIGGLALDITAEQQLDEERAQLTGLVSHAQKMEALGLLAGEMAHDLDETLSGIAGQAESIKASTDLPSKTLERVDIIHRCGTMASDLIEDVMELAGGSDHRQVRIQWNDIIQETIEAAADRFQEAGMITVDARLDPELPEVNGSAGQLRRMLDRLLAYAEANIGKNAGTIGIETRAETLEEWITGYQQIPAGQYAVLRFFESGPPLSEEDLERFFDPFYLKDRLGRAGCGLWMPVVWGIVGQHDGYVHVRSSAEDGNVIEIYLPL